MAAEIVLKLTGYTEDIVFSVIGKTITIYNTAIDATSFCFTIGAADWEKVKSFIDEKLKASNG